MFFYTSLFIASLFMALVVLWLYRSLVGIGRAVYRAILPSSKSNITNHVKDDDLVTTINDTPTPWGWQSRSTPARVAKTVAAVPENSVPSSQSVPWGWKGNKHKVGEYKVKEGIPLKPAAATTNPLNTARQSDQSDWPDHVDEFDFAGSKYKVTRKVKPKKSNLKKVSKPWGW